MGATINLEHDLVAVRAGLPAAFPEDELGRKKYGLLR